MYKTNNLSTFSDVRNSTPYAPEFPRMTSELFLELKKYLDKTESSER